MVVAPPDTVESGPDLGNWVGGGKGTVIFRPGYDSNDPAWKAVDWESW